MAFHNVTLPDGFRYGSLCGPTFRTIVTKTASGHEIRVTRTSTAPRRFKLQKTDLSAAQLRNMKEFCLGRRGALHSFRLTDWEDYSSAADGTSAPGPQDQVLGTADGSSNQTFQLVKLYDASGPDPFTATVTLPQSGTVRVALDGVETFAFSCSSAGVVTLTGTAGQVVTAGFKYDCEVRFDENVDQWLQIQTDAYGVFSLPALDCLQVIDEVAWPETEWPGGSVDHGAVSSDQSLAWIDGHLHSFTPSGTVNVFLPSVADCPGGDRGIVIVNAAVSAASLQVRDETGAAVGAAISAGQVREALLLVSSGSATWILVSR